MDNEKNVQFLDIDRARTEAFAYAAPTRPYSASISELAIDRAAETVETPSREEIAKACAAYVSRVGILNIHNRREAIKNDVTLAA